MAERLRQVAGLVADLEREQQVPARCQCAMEFGEHRRQFLWWCVDDRVPRDDTAESTIRCVHSGDRAFVEPQVRIRLPGHGNHRWREVDTEGVQPERTRVRRHPAGSATKITHWPGAVRVDEFCEHGQQRTVQGLGRELVADPLGIVGGDGVVARPSDAHVGRLDHARHRTDRVGHRAASHTRRSARRRRGHGGRAWPRTSPQPRTTTR
jgi:hypothetical protein